ncbi:MAG: hypothetical protein M1820_004477 [Bogoriella megaspora]|nr:MAG: hypothetical protein M1820_004477 [Bogoriella megaspora]
MPTTATTKSGNKPDNSSERNSTADANRSTVTRRDSGNANPNPTASSGASTSSSSNASDPTLPSFESRFRNLMEWFNDYAMKDPDIGVPKDSSSTVNNIPGYRFSEDKSIALYRYFRTLKPKATGSGSPAVPKARNGNIANDCQRLKDELTRAIEMGKTSAKIQTGDKTLGTKTDQWTVSVRFNAETAHPDYTDKKLSRNVKSGWQIVNGRFEMQKIFKWAMEDFQQFRVDHSNYDLVCIVTKTDDESETLDTSSFLTLTIRVE